MGGLLFQTPMNGGLKIISRYKEKILEKVLYRQRI